MSESFQFELKGFKELDKLLKQLPQEAAKKALEPAVRAGANVIRKEARANAPGKELKRHIIVKKSRRTQYSVTYQIGTTKKAFYAHFFEFGTSPHLIKVFKKKSLAGGGAFFGKEVQHPGQKAKPFLRPAMDTKRGEALQKIGEKLMETINKEAVKLASSLNLFGNKGGRRR